jgi:LuxR family maltose regulon positive regulatory protein
MTNYRLYCLGRPFLEADVSPVKLEMRKSLALLIYLRMVHHDTSRESLATLFWPEYDQKHALANLRRTLSSLNKSLQGELLLADREKIGLRDHKTVWLDVEEFQKILSKVKDHTHPKNQTCSDCLRSLEEAVALYQGDFLEGFNLEDCSEFDEWRLIQGENLRQELAGGLQRIAEGYAAQSAWEQAIFAARRWVALDRLNELAQRYLIHLYEEAGQHNASLRQYDELSRILQDELGQTPNPETTALYQKILERSASTTKDKVKEYQNETAGYQSAEPLLKTKLYIPTSHKEKVLRQRLFDKLNQIEQYPLVIISAPAGFGKTTTLVEWISQTTLPVAWYSLDNDDNEFRRFVNYLITTLDSIQSGICSGTQSLLRAPQSTTPQQVFSHIIHDLESLRSPFVLVLDDYQFITSQTIHDALTFFLDYLSPYTHVIIATRADPPLKLARLRSREQLLEIRTNDLRFTPEEAFEYLNHVMGLSISNEDIGLLEKKIEGWIAGLQMAALSMRDHEDLHGFIEGFSGTNRYILDYLMEEVLASQPSEIQHFLLRTSILERLTPPLCDAILTCGEGANHEGDDRSTVSGSVFNDHSAPILEYLERANLFLVPLDDERKWYRYHHLFADLLRTRLQRLLGDQGVAHLHICASEWHAQHGSILEAINHASAASDDERVERFIEQNYVEMVSRGEMSEMRYWTGKINKELVNRRPRLCIYEAYSHSWLGELDEADRLLEIAEKRLRSETLLADAVSLQGLLAYVKSRVTAMRGDLHGAIELCLAARENIPESNIAPQMQFDTLVTLGYEYFLIGDYENASPILIGTIQSGITAGAVIHTAAASCILARLYAYQGLLHKTYNTYQIASKLIPEASGEHRDARALVEIGIADVLCEWNDLDGAPVHLQRGLTLLPFWAKVDDLVLAYITLMRIQMAQAKRAEAQIALEKALHIIKTRGVFCEARNAVTIAQVKLWLNLGKTDKAAEWLAQYQVKISKSAQVWRESEDIASIRVMLALGRFLEAQSLLATLTASAETGGRIKNLIEITILRALALHATGSDLEALGILHRALALAQPEGFLRIFLDEGKPIFDLLLLGKEKGMWDSSPLEAYTSRLLLAYQDEKR